MRRRIAVVALAAAALWGGFFIAAYQALTDEDWPEW